MERRPIPGLPHYYATADGEILSRNPYWKSRKFRKLALRKKNNGYVQVHLPSGHYLVHRLICRTFHGEPPTAKHEVRHLNGNQADNRAVNLVWGTQVENFLDKVSHGRLKLDPESVKRLRYYLMLGAKREDLARVFKCGYQNICFIARGDTWRMEEAGYTQEFLDWIETEKEIAAALGLPDPSIIETSAGV